MKKINSIGYGRKVLFISFILGILIPLIFTFFYQNSICRILLWVFLSIGMIIFFGFLIFLVIELNQDKRINQRYQRNHQHLLMIEPHLFECEACGARFDLPLEECPLCHKHLYNSKKKT